MKETLLERTQEWMQLERKTAEQRKEAETYYEEKLMDLIVEDYIERNQKLILEDVKYLVVSVGTSYEPIILNINLFKPEKILFLYTTTSERVLDKIVSYCQLKVSQYEKSKVSETDPIDIYREIKEAYVAWGKPDKMFIDFTGGTKSMSAACAMAGSLIDVQLVYVGTEDYLVDFRKPRPGSEQFFYITNPLSVFGDLEIEKSLNLFSEFNYAGAKEKLEYLKESIPDPGIRQQMNFVYLLAKAYEAWDALDFVPAYEHIKKLNFQLSRDYMHRDYLLMDFANQLHKQEKILELVKEIPEMISEKKNMEILQNKELMSALMFTMYQNAMTREKQDKLDMATLLLYRLLEMIEQRRLAKYNLNVSAMDYQKMKINVKRQEKYLNATAVERVEILKADVNNIKKSLFGKAGSGYLPEQVSLLEGFTILYAFQDPIVYRSENDNLAMLKAIRSKVFLRNNSIFAHGLGPVKRSDYTKFRDFVIDLFKIFCKIEKIDFGDISGIVEMINPTDSDNYAALEEK